MAAWAAGSENEPVSRCSSLQQAQHREHAAEDRKCLCEHRTGEAPRDAGLQARKLGA